MDHVYGCSLVLAFDGDCTSVDATGPKSAMIRQLESSEIFSTVTVASLKAEPALPSVVESLPTGDVIVIPFFTCDDHDSHARLTASLLASTDPVRHRLRIAPSIGAQPETASAVLSRLVTNFIEHKLPPNDTTVIVLGAGSEREPDMGLSTYGLAGVVRSAVANLNVSVGFLNQRPFFDSIPHTIKTCHTLIIPFLAEFNLATANTIRRAFGQDETVELQFPHRFDSSGQICICDLPVGWYPEMAAICLDLAADQMTNIGSDSDADAA